MASLQKRNRVERHSPCAPLPGPVLWLVGRGGECGAEGKVGVVSAPPPAQPKPSPTPHPHPPLPEVFSARLGVSRERPGPGPSHSQERKGKTSGRLLGYFGLRGRGGGGKDPETGRGVLIGPDGETAARLLPSPRGGRGACRGREPGLTWVCCSSRDAGGLRRRPPQLWSRRGAFPTVDRKGGEPALSL